MRVLVTVLGLAVCSIALAQQPKYSPTPPIVQLPPGKGTKVRAIYAPKPNYPLYARQRHWTGIGWFVMNLDTKTGFVKSVTMLQSTGHKMLDDEVIKTFSRWRFEPGKGAPRVKFPITFSMASEKNPSGR
jgi:TonB family protein